jgi:hypothetical protein
LAERGDSSMRKKIKKKINNQDDYEKSSFKGIVNKTEDPKNKALESAVPKIGKGQIPSDTETSKEILYSDSIDDNINRKLEGNTKEKVISSKISKFAKGFKIPNDKRKKK